MSHGPAALEVWMCGNDGKLHPVLICERCQHLHTPFVAGILNYEHPKYMFWHYWKNWKFIFHVQKSWKWKQKSWIHLEEMMSHSISLILDRALFFLVLLWPRGMLQMTHHHITSVKNNSFMTVTSRSELGPDAKPAENHGLKTPFRIADKVALQQEWKQL